MSDDESSYQKAKRDNSITGILFMDLDGFKHINDTFRHDIGDRVLVDTANILKKSIRESDVVARVGGDEFICVLVEVDSMANTEMIAERIIRHVPMAVSKLSAEKQFGVSIGGLVFGPNHNEIDGLISQADELMYEAKSAGKGRSVIRELS